MLLNNQKTADILLVMCPMWGLDMPPLGISYLASYLENKGFSAEVLDMNIKLYSKSSEENKKLWNMQKYPLWGDDELFPLLIKRRFQKEIDYCVDYILSRGVNVVGFSIYGANQLFSIEIAKGLKSKNPYLTIIFGGSTCFWLDENCVMPSGMYSYKTGAPLMPMEIVDIFVKGEGENTLYEIMTVAPNKKKYLGIPGTIVYFEGKYSKFAPRELINDLDSLPPPALDKFPLHLYLHKKLPILMSRGCPRRCTFCNDWQLTGLSFRMRSAQNILEEIKYHVEKYQVKHFLSCDLLVNGNIKELEKLADLLIDSNLNIVWTGQGIIRKDMDYHLLKKMKQSGCEGITYGIESFSDKVLKLMNKPYSAKDAQVALENTKKAGIRNAINLIIGFPGEGEEEFKETLEFLKTNHKLIDMISSMNPCNVTGPTELEHHPENFSIKLPKLERWSKWESLDGENTYPVRKKRIRQIENLLKQFKIPIQFIGIHDEDIEESEKTGILNTAAIKTDIPDILLIICPPWGVETPPLGIASLSNYLRCKGFKVEAFDFNIYLYNKVDGQHRYLWEMGNSLNWRSRDSFENILYPIFKESIEYCVEKIIFSGVKVVGFSVLSVPQDMITAEIIKRVKAKNPTLKVILGGTSISVDEQRSYYYDKSISSLIDAYVIGEGEEILQEVLAAYKENKDIKGIPGVLINREGKYIYLPRPLKEKLDTFLYPTFEEFDLSSYLNKGKSLIMEWTRGCIGRCSFCAFKIISSKFRKKNIDLILKALSYYKNKYNTEHITLVDSAINCDHVYLKKTCDSLITSRLNMEFSALAMPRKEIDSELLDKLRKAGFYRLEYGVESGSNEVLKAMNKLFTVEDIEKTIFLTHQAGITAVIYLIVGFPGEGETQFQETVEFLKRNAQYIDLVRSINPLYLIAGSPVYKNYKAYGINLPKENQDFQWWIGEENNYEIRVQRVNKIRETLDSINVKYVKEANQGEGKIEFVKKEERIPQIARTEPKDILLVICPMWAVNMPPLGISYLYSYLEDKGHKTKALDLNIEIFHESSNKDLWKMQNYRLWNDKNLFERNILSLHDNTMNSCAEKILSENIKIIGFSVNAGNLLFSIELAKRIKDRNRDKIIIFGGPHAKWFKQDISFLERYTDVYSGFYPGLVDFFVIGEGEGPLASILDCLKNNNEVNAVANTIAFKDNKYVCLGNESFVDNLNSLPFPDFSWAGLNKYTNRRMPILMSRGCIRKCAFCNDTFVSAKYRCREANNVFGEMKLLLKKYEVNAFEFCDLILNGNPKELEKLSDLITKEKIAIQWVGQAAITKHMSNSLLTKMKKAGCSAITYGIESFSDKVLKLMNKPYTYEDIEEVLKATALAGISANINIVTGFPGENEEEFRQTIEGIKNCREYINGISSLTPCLITLGSDLQIDLSKHNIIYPDQDGYFRWYTMDGNNYDLRKRRAKTILSLASTLKIPINTINLYDEQNERKDKLMENQNANISVLHKKEKVDVVLVTLPPWGVENPPVGLGYLDSYIRNKGLKSKVYDFNIHFFTIADNDYKMLWHVENKNYWSNEKTFPLLCEVFKNQIDYTVEKILSCETNLIGFSVVDPKERITIEVIKRIKKEAPEKKIILGGPACSTEEQRNFFIKNIPDYIDYFVVGEGEETLYEIIQKEKNGIESSDIAGLAIRENGKWRHIARQPIYPLDAIPFPTYEAFDFNQYNAGKTLLVEWSRGCIGNCSFCKGRSLAGRYRNRSARLVIEELRYNVTKRGIKDFTICDSLVNGNIKELDLICELIIKEKLNLRWSAQAISLPAMTGELLSKMKGAGCWKLQWGIESGSEKVLKNMNKTLFTPEDARRVLRDSYNVGIANELFILVGFPGEDEDEFQKTIDFIKRNKKYISAIKSINSVHIIPGTDLYENPQNYGVILPKEDLHYKWYAHDGNDYITRNNRMKKLISVARVYGIEIIETNISEGKQDRLKDRLIDKDQILLELKKDINSIKSVPIYESCIGKDKRKPLLVIRFFRHLKDYGLFPTSLKTMIHLWYLYNKFSVLIKNNIIKRMKGPFGFIRNNLDMVSFLTGSTAYVGPRIVQIDVTSDCYNNCIGCWCYSPLLGELRLNGQKRKEYLTLELVKSLIDELYFLKTGTIQLSGSGEPFMHPGILNIIEYIKKKGMQCHIITSLSLTNENIIRKLIDFRVDQITVSLWAANADTYIKTHPGRKKIDFCHIENMLKGLDSFKKQAKSVIPQVKIYNVICNLNYHELEKMLDFALHVGANSLEFTIMDSVPGKTEVLLLNTEQQDIVLRQMESMKYRINRYDSLYQSQENQKHPIELVDIGRCVRTESIPKGFQYEFNSPSDISIKCPRGIKSVYFFPDEGAGYFSFRFSKLQCDKCHLFKDCAINKYDFMVSVEFLKILGFYSFYRRVTHKSVSKGEYDNQIVDSFPCYAGWIYSRILPNGDVIPCCKAVKNSTGNIYRDNFTQIWNSRLQKEFRYMGRFFRNHSYFSKINCHKSCDNLGMNLETHLEMESRLKAISHFQKRLLNLMAFFYDFKNKLTKPPQSRTLRFIIILMLLCLKLIFDIYMLFFRLLYKKRVFPGG